MSVANEMESLGLSKEESLRYQRPAGDPYDFYMDDEHFPELYGKKDLTPEETLHSIAKRPPEEIPPIKLEIDSGDTLSEIARNSHIPLGKLTGWYKETYPEGNPDVVHPGEEITLPDDWHTYVEVGEETDVSEPVVEAPTMTFDEEVAQLDLDHLDTTSMDNTVYDSALDSFATTETTDAHVDGRNYFTMPYGVVPDGGVTLNGKPTSATAGTITKGNLSKVDYSKATKRVGNTTLNRADYTTDKEFAGAVLKEFEKVAKDKLESDSGKTTAFTGSYDDLPVEAKQAVLDLAWNYQQSSAWNDTALMANEMLKRPAERSTHNLIKFTQNMSSNDTNQIGLLRRRAIAYNMVAKEGDEVAYIKQGDPVSGKTTYDLLREDGTTIKSWKKDNATPVHRDKKKTKTPYITIDGVWKTSI